MPTTARNQYYEKLNLFLILPIFPVNWSSGYAMTAKQAASKCAVLWLDDSFLLFSCVHELFTFDPKEADNFYFF